MMSSRFDMAPTEVEGLKSPGTGKNRSTGQYCRRRVVESTGIKALGTV